MIDRGAEIRSDVRDGAAQAAKLPGSDWMSRNKSRNSEVIFRDAEFLTRKQVINQFREFGLRFQ